MRVKTGGAMTGKGVCVDPHLFLDAPVELLCDKASGVQVRVGGREEGGAAACCGKGGGCNAPPLLPAGLFHSETPLPPPLHAHTQAFHRARAALDGLSVFVDTVLMMHAARQRSLALDQQLPPTVDAAAAAVAGEGDTMMVDGVAPSATATTVCSSAPPEEEGGAEGLPAVIDELLPRVLHCCCEDTWQVCVWGSHIWCGRWCGREGGGYAAKGVSLLMLDKRGRGGERVTTVFSHSS